MEHGFRGVVAISAERSPFIFRHILMTIFGVHEGLWGSQRFALVAARVSVPLHGSSASAQSWSPGAHGQSFTLLVVAEQANTRSGTLSIAQPAGEEV